MSNYKLSYSGGQINNAISRALNPDATPTQSSAALITSGGVYEAIRDIEVEGGATITSFTPTTLNGVLAGNGSAVTVKTVDDTPTANSANLISSGGVAEALAPWGVTWHHLTLASGITGGIDYWKDPNGMVWLKIATSTDTAAAAQMLGVLPDGYRPEFVHIFFGYNTDHGYTLRYTVSSDGAIRAYAFLSSSTILDPSTTTFKTCRGYTAFCVPG